MLPCKDPTLGTTVNPDLTVPTHPSPLADRPAQPSTAVPYKNRWLPCPAMPSPHIHYTTDELYLSSLPPFLPFLLPRWNRQLHIHSFLTAPSRQSEAFLFSVWINRVRDCARIPSLQTTRVVDSPAFLLEEEGTFRCPGCAVFVILPIKPIESAREGGGPCLLLTVTSSNLSSQLRLRLRLRFRLCILD